MSSNTPPKVLTIQLKQGNSSTDSSNTRPTSHKKSKIAIKVKKEEVKQQLFSTTKKISPKSKKSIVHKPFILPPVTKQSQEIDTKVIRPSLGDKVDVASNFKSNLTHIIKSHFGSIQYQKKTRTGSTRSTQTSSTTTSSTSMSNQSNRKSPTTLPITTITQSSFNPSNYQRCYVEDFMKV
jgi:hypothetical protein